MVNFGVTAAVSAESNTTEAGVDEAFTLFETCALAAGDFPQAGTLGSNETICCGIFWLGGKLSRYCRCWMYLMANLRDSIFDNLFPGGLHHGSLALKSSNDLFMSFMRARSRSQAERLYCSLLTSSSNLLAPVRPSLVLLLGLPDPVGCRWMRMDRL